MCPRKNVNAWEDVNGGVQGEQGENAGGVQEVKIEIQYVQENPPEDSQDRYPSGENDLTIVYNTGLSTGPRGGNRLGPYQETIDQGIHLQVTRPNIKNKPRLEDLNLGSARKVMKRWKEIKLV